VAEPERAAISEERLRAGGEFDQASFTGLQLGSARLAGTRFSRCRFVRTTLSEADLERATLDDVEFADCDLSSVRLGGARLTDVTFRRCKLLGVDWSTAARSLIGQPLVFERCQLDFGIFRSANLRGSAFHDCSAREVDLVGCDLGEASLRGTNLERARFGETRLVDADLTGAYGYELDPRENDVRGLRVSLPEGAALLRIFGIVVDPT
jgi:uncharacterized protein YjbI with pentapeptide repeats